MGALTPLRTFRHSLRRMVARPARELDPAQAYDLWAATYDDTSGNALLHVEESAFAATLETLDLREKAVLDAGCGTGRHFAGILNRGPASLTGIDISGNMLQQAAGKAPPGASPLLCLATVEDVPFRDEAFDCIISTLVLDHVPHLERGLVELCRVLRPRGILLVTTFHPFGKLLSWERSFQAPTGAGNKGWYSARYFFHSHADYFNILRGCGMEVLRMEEPVIDDSIKHFYERAGRLDIFRRFRGYPMLLTFVARRT